MDKAQKQLIDTYVRKRIIANQEYALESQQLTDKEFNYIRKNYPGVLQKAFVNNLNGRKIAMLIVDNPEYVDNLLKVDVDQIDGQDIGNIIIYRPELLKNEIIQKFMYKLKAENITAILLERPELADGIRSELYKLNDDDAGFIVSRHPKLIDIKNHYGENVFHPEDMDAPEIAYILAKQPQLINRFNYKKLIDSFWLNDLLKAQPQLAPYFKTEKNG